MQKRAEDRRYHFTYQVTCSYNGRVFYGVHSIDSLDAGFDGRGTALYESIKDYGKEQHKFERLVLYPTRLEAKAAYNELKASQIKNPKRPEDRKHHNVYRTTRFDGKFYIGVHSTDDLGDGYMGSGTYIGRSLKKHGRDRHVLEILHHCATRKEAFKKEAGLVTIDFIIDKMCMNNTIGGNEHGARVYGFTEESKRLIGLAAKKAHEDGKFAHLKGAQQKPEHVEKRAKANTGKKRTAEQIENLNRGQQEYYASADQEALNARGQKGAVTRKERGTNLGGRPKGTPMTEEQKDNLSKSHVLVNQNGEQFHVPNLSSFCYDRGIDKRALLNTSKRNKLKAPYLYTVQSIDGTDLEVHSKLEFCATHNIPRTSFSRTLQTGKFVCGYRIIAISEITRPEFVNGFKIQDHANI